MPHYRFVLGDEMFLPLDYIGTGQEQLFIYLKLTTTHLIVFSIFSFLLVMPAYSAKDSALAVKPDYKKPKYSSSFKI